MLNWLWKWMGYHVCEEFTRWETKEVVRQRAAVGHELRAGISKVNVRVRWQERTCTICGAVHQRKLKGM